MVLQLPGYAAVQDLAAWCCSGRTMTVATPSEFCFCSLSSARSPELPSSSCMADRFKHIIMAVQQKALIHDHDEFTLSELRNRGLDTPKRVGCEAVQGIEYFWNRAYSQFMNTKRIFGQLHILRSLDGCVINPYSAG